MLSLYMLWWLLSVLLSARHDWYNSSWENSIDYTSYPKCFNKCHCLCCNCADHNSFYSVTAKLWGLCYFWMHQTKRLYILLGNHLLPCLQTKHHKTQVVWSLLDCYSSSMSRLFLQLFILSTNLFSHLALSMVGFLIFPSKSQDSMTMSGLVCVANQLKGVA